MQTGRKKDMTTTALITGGTSGVDRGRVATSASGQTAGAATTAPINVRFSPVSGHQEPLPDVAEVPIAHIDSVNALQWVAFERARCTLPEEAQYP
jgi:hypothetical protein